MISFILKRLSWFLPVILLVLLVLFVLDQYTLQDQFHRAVINDKYSQNTVESDSDLLQQMAEQRGWVYPPFYFSIQFPGWSPSVHQEVNPTRKKFIQQLTRHTLDYSKAKTIADRYFSIIDASKLKLNKSESYATLVSFYRDEKPEEFWEFCKKLSNNEVQDEAVIELIALIKSIPNPGWRQAIPTLFWHGRQCRIHRFLEQYCLNGNQRSLVDGRPIYSKIWPAAGITLLINILALVLLILFGIPLGQYLYRVSDRWLHPVFGSILYLLYALPLFWVATLLLVVGAYFSGALLTGAPSLIPGETPSMFTFLRPKNWMYLLLPILSIFLSLIAVIAIQMYRSLAETGNEKFIMAATSKGLGDIYVLKKHNRPVALYSMLTIIGNSIPQLISGSVIIEIIFNIPGMGRLLWQSIFAFDWAVVSGVLIVGVLFSIVGQLLTDLTYYYLNPAMRSEQ